MKRMTLQKNNSTKTIQEGFKEFYRFCRVKNLSEPTLTYYQETLDTFQNFYPLSNQISTINKTITDDYVLFLKNNSNMNDISINTKIKGLRTILYYFMELEYMDNFKIKLMMAQKKIKETYTDAELKLLLKKPNLKQCGFAEYRDWTIVNYLLGTGNRVDTIVNVRIKDIDFESGYIKLDKTKNKRQQLIPLSNVLAKVLTEYLQYRDGEKEDYLFVSVYGAKLNGNSLGHSIKKYNQRRGVLKTSVHLFRHTFAKKWILNGGDIFRLQKILGHSTLDIVREYVNMFGEDLQKDYDKFNALEQMTEVSKHTMVKPSKMGSMR
ncbi:phage integrase family protein [Alkaliphilus metalliredigens QYMF]|uniref:Phage integrase family protein n=1 Tax=Alkaliphilus metalliredigens (strain QYMF) TaxID=293826 RepID=A6TS35_ALKMQ|nr:tyrosine-type recombinase/integrase [Alkaliphilus metalliredigens]ABR49003.1 phage integrase family protein [Alkaliphilus metalliredigens QYMF]